MVLVTSCITRSLKTTLNVREKSNVIVAITLCSFSEGNTRIYQRFIWLQQQRASGTCKGEMREGTNWCQIMHSRGVNGLWNKSGALIWHYKTFISHLVFEKIFLIVSGMLIHRMKFDIRVENDIFLSAR